jgi:hypothetical protein
MKSLSPSTRQRRQQPTEQYRHQDGQWNARQAVSGLEPATSDMGPGYLTRLRALKISLWCPHCQLGHAVLGKDVHIVQDKASFLSA